MTATEDPIPTDAACSVAPPDVAPGRSLGAHLVAGVVLTLAITGGLFFYKWSGAYATVSTVRASGALARPIDTLATGGALAATLHYFKLVWPALVFGILIGAAVRAFISPRWLLRLLGERPARQQVMGALAGSPLMLCSCCVTPVFTGVYERGVRLGPSLAVMLASPGLNVAALVLTFLLFPLHLALGRLLLTLLAVLGLSALLGRLFDTPALRATSRRRRLEAQAPEEMPRSVPAMAQRFAREVATMTLVTVPLIVLGVVLSSLVLPAVLNIGAVGGYAAVALVAVLSVLVALPTFFEIPLALVLLKLGAPEGAALALLVAGPIINLPSLFVLARETRPRMAAALGVGVALLAFAGGTVFV
jgi:hypothetical protein